MSLVIKSEQKPNIHKYFSLSYTQGIARGLIEVFEGNLENFVVFCTF